ncbi:MAG: hypothetical protein V3S09_04695 [Candidatus Bathyarchaeia archaeon]
MVDGLKKVPHGEQCDAALEHYLKISNEASHSSSLVPEAIEFYKERYVPQGERKILFYGDYDSAGKAGEELDKYLAEGWTFDPWLNPGGRPITTGRDSTIFYWALVKGTPEQIAGMDPIAELPDLEEELPEPGMEPYGLRTDYIPYDPKGEPSREPKPGYVVMHKDHVYAKGTVYTLPPGAPSSWALAIGLANLSTYLGVDEAHDVIVGILKKERAELSG